MILKLMDLSTSHISFEDNRLLTINIKKNIELPTRIIPHDYGYLVSVIEESQKELFERIKEMKEFGLSQYFIHNYCYAAVQKCSWISYDCDADVDDKLRHIFNW